MKRELSGKVNRELSGKTLKDLSNEELVEVMTETVRSQTQALRFNESFVPDTSSINFPRDIINSEAHVVGHVESIHYNSKDGYSMTFVITDQKTINEIMGENKCQSIRLSSKMKTETR